MNRKARTAVATVGASLIAMSGLSLAHASAPAASATVATRDGSSGNTAAKEKKAVLNLLAAYSTGNAAAFDVINPKKFIQHDPQVADGLSGLKAWLASMPQGQISVKPVRVLVDGSYVLVQSETRVPSGPTVAWDVFRFSLFGEPLYNGAGYIQHSEGTTTDGAAASKAVLQQFVESGTLVYTKIEKVLGEGNFVLVIGKGSFAGTPYSFYDMFRVDNGKLTEHWDVLEPLTPAAQAKNTNGQFDFPQDPLGPPLA